MGKHIITLISDTHAKHGMITARMLERKKHSFTVCGGTANVRRIEAVIKAKQIKRLIL